jgi:hypothetical protein
MNICNCRIEGVSPLLQHRYPLETTTTTSRRKDTTNNLDAVKSYLYTDPQGKICQPAEHIIGSLKEAGKKFQIKGMGKSTYFKVIGSGAVIVSPAWILHEIPDWTVDRRPVVIKQARIVRERFDKWSLSFQIDFDETLIPAEDLKQVLDYAGRYCGIGDYRPAKGGPFGRFMVTIFQKVE